MRRRAVHRACAGERLVRSELRKLTTTKMPWVFFAVLLAVSAMTAIAVIYGKDADGCKTFISTAEEQRSLMAFSFNAMIGAGLFAAIAAAREYGHGTVIPTFLTTPRRVYAALAQFRAMFVAGAVMGIVGTAVVIAAVAMALPATKYGFLMSAPVVGRLLAASAFAGAAGAVLGGGVGAIVKHTGGAVTRLVLLLFIAPPLVAQLASGASSWVPGTLVNVLSGVSHEVSLPAAAAALAGWALVAAAVGLLAIRQRDIASLHDHVSHVHYVT